LIPEPRALQLQPIRRRVLTSLLAGIAMLVLLCTSSIGLIAAAHRSLAMQTSAVDDLSDYRRLLSQAISLQETTVLDYQLTQRAESVKVFAQAGRDEAAAEARLMDLVANNPVLSGNANDVVSLAATWRREWADPVMKLIEAGRTIPATGPLSNDEGERRFAQVQLALKQLDDGIDQRRSVTAASQQAVSDTLIILIVGASIAFGVGLLLLGIWLLRTVSAPLARLSQTAASLVAGQEVRFRAERDDEIGTLAEVLERLRGDVEGRYATALADAERSATYSKLADLISFSATEDQLVEAAMRAIRRLTGIAQCDIQLSDPSRYRWLVAGSSGEAGPPVGPPGPSDRLDLCPGVRRGSVFVIPDVGDDLAVRCPAHPTLQGAAACVPMMALGQVAGVIHIAAPDGNLGGDTVPIVARIAEQIAIALVNTRLMRTLEGLAMTDSLTGLHNARFFDSFLKQQLALGERDNRPTGLIMIDVDHFKEFNDEHGHPAGDEALRSFGRVVKAAIRASDVVARYGGEEFIVALPSSNQEETRGVAEKLRLAVEEMVIEIAPGRYAHATISLGVVATDQQHFDQKGLVAMADKALYRAKEGGRNQVAVAPSAARSRTLAARRRLRRTLPEPPIPIARRSRAKPA
jgi:diguanylate cyclase (GGDEF)-like protein